MSSRITLSQSVARLRDCERKWFAGYAAASLVYYINHHYTRTLNTEKQISKSQDAGMFFVGAKVSRSMYPATLFTGIFLKRGHVPGREEVSIIFGGSTPSARAEPAFHTSKSTHLPFPFPVIRLSEINASNRPVIIAMYVCWKLL